ncbi:MAG: alpha/beta hydrolase [Syntrophales bacterium]
MKQRLSVTILHFFIYILLSAPITVWGAGIGKSAPAGIDIRTITVQSVRVGDIDISYRTVGSGPPLLLITGYSATMDMWDPVVLKELSSRYRVIVFDNRGIGKTTASDKPFTIELFAEDTIGLLDALKIKKAHVLGWSMGAFIATEATLRHPDRVGKLILYGGNCGWRSKEVVPAAPEVTESLTSLSGTPAERSQRLIRVLYPEKWLQDHPDFLKSLPRPKAPVSRDSITRQSQAMGTWKGTCGRIGEITQSTLVITGTEDVVVPPANSLLMASRIPRSWLIRLPGGHANMYQYPETFSRALLTFLDAETDR